MMPQPIVRLEISVITEQETPMSRVCDERKYTFSDPVVISHLTTNDPGIAGQVLRSEMEQAQRNISTQEFFAKGGG